MVKVEYCGHSCFMISDGTHSVIIDPFLTGNAQASLKPEDVKVDAVILTHGHGDHAGDGVDIAKASNATVVAPYELAAYCEKKGAAAHAMHIGGAYTFPFARVKLVPAWHGSAVMEGDDVIYTGNPCGVLVTMDGKTIYHAGDTALFGDMQLIGERHDIDVALLPIGDNFTMGIDDAIYAVQLIKPKHVVPMHYNTFPVIEVDPGVFADGVKKLGFDCTVMNPGESLTA